MGSAAPPRRPALALLLTAAVVIVAGGHAEAQLILGFEPVAAGLSLPLGLVHAGDGSGRLFIVEQAGRIKVFDGTVVRATPFLDVSALVSCCSERGLLGLAFHPDYRTNGVFYVHYTNTAGDTTLALSRLVRSQPRRRGLRPDPPQHQPALRQSQWRPDRVRARSLSLHG